MYIFQKEYQKISLHALKNSLAKKYRKLWEKHGNQLRKVFAKQGKLQISKTANENTIESIVMDSSYYLTDLDVWIFAMISEIQICLFNPNKLRGTNVEWFLIGPKYKNITYFIRSGIFTKSNKPMSFHLITPAHYLSNLEELDRLVQQENVGRLNKKEHLITFEDYLDIYD